MVKALFMLLLNWVFWICAATNVDFDILNFFKEIYVLILMIFVTHHPTVDVNCYIGFGFYITRHFAHQSFFGLKCPK